MKHRWVLLITWFFLFLGASMSRAQTRDNKSVLRLDPALDSLLSPDAQLKLVKGGFGFTEGINWIQKGQEGYLLFSDIPANVVDRMTPGGQVSVYVDHAGYHGILDGYTMMTIGELSDNGKDHKDPLFRQFVMIGPDGTTLDPQGRILICTFAGRSLDRIEKDGKRTILADRYEGKRFSGPNDVIVKKDGAIFFTDSSGGLRGRDKGPLKELDFLGTYRIKDGKLTRAVLDIETPNGLAFSPDEKYLYVNASRSNFIRRYDVQPDDTLTNSRLLIDLNGDKTLGFTDGMRVDSKGNIYSSGPGGIWIISPEGKHLGTIFTPEQVANLTFGDADWKTLYIAARTSIYMIRVNTPGRPCSSCTQK